MVALMAKKRQAGATRPSSSGRRAPGRKDVFARLDGEIVDKLDSMVEAMRPRTTRSALVAQLIEEYVAAKWPEFQARQAAQGN
jgi:hypothetical protein